MRLSPKDKFDRYTIERVLGQGGMGRVFLAYDTRLRRRVALKLLHGETGAGSSGDGSGQLLREARAAAAFTHPNAVSVYDVAEFEGEPFITMELVRGKPLRAFIGDASVTLAQKLRWMSDLASALGAAHANGLVHRDVKPTNVLIREDGVLKVFDFGIARVTRKADEPGAPDDGPTLQNTGSILGTPRYMAPEQLRDGTVDGRADQFAWGVIAYSLITGTSPWRTGESEIGVISAILTQLVTPPRTLAPQTPEGVSAIIMRALEKDPLDRYPQMELIVAALRPFVASAEPAPPVPAGANRTMRMLDTPPLRVPTASDTPPPMAEASRTISTPALPRDSSASRLSADESSQLRTITPARTPSVNLFLIALGTFVALSAIGISATILIQRRRASSTRVESPEATPNKAVALTDLPLPTSTNAQALSAYSEGMQALRDGANRSATRDFSRAIELDPTIAPAHLRLAIYNFYASPSDARVHYRHVVERRASLSEHDRALADAMEPYIARQPADHAELERRLVAAMERFPLDAEFALLRAYTDAGVFENEAAELARYDHAIDLDPSFGLAYGYKVQAQAYWGDFDGAYATVDACGKKTSSGTICMHMRNVMDQHFGRCARVEATARQLIAMEPAVDYNYSTLAFASYATGATLDATKAALEQAWARQEPSDRAITQARDSFSLHILAGKLSLAEADAKTHASLVGADASLAAHASVARELVAVRTEMGHTDEAVQAAQDYLHHREAWVPDPRGEDFAVARDPAPLMLSVELRAGRITPDAFESARDAWLRMWKPAILKNFAPFLWIHGYAAPAETKEQAVKALDALPGYLPIPIYAPRMLAAAHVGHVYLLADRVDEALPYLKAATSSCFALTDPIDHTHAELWLGNALENKGDRAGACAAYAVVLDRWGHAEPKSVTANKARERSRALACGK